MSARYIYNNITNNMLHVLLRLFLSFHVFHNNFSFDTTNLTRIYLCSYVQIKSHIKEQKKIDVTSHTLYITFKCYDRKVKQMMGKLIISLHHLHHSIRIRIRLYTRRSMYS